MSNESTGQQMAVGPAGGSSWVAAAARAVYSKDSIIRPGRSRLLGFEKKIVRVV